MSARSRRFRSYLARGGPFAAGLLVLCVVAGGLAGPAAAGRGMPAFERSGLVIHTRSGAVHRFTIEVARTREQQALGLMFRRRLPADAGMLFLNDRVERARMWMKNTYIPLDMLFVASDGRIVEMKQRTVPLSLAIISSRKPVLAVLEVNAGTVSRLGIAIGDRLDHPAFGAAK